MQFILANSWADGVASLSDRLNDELASDKKVLWLVSGGSNIPASVEIMSSVPWEQSLKLSIMLNDERFGPPGHTDSNWTQLFEAGFEPKQSKMLPILQANMSYDETLRNFAQQTEQAFAENNIVISQIGMGADSHVAGILPDSPAAQEQSALVAGFESSPYTRLTLTFPALKKVDVAYVMVFGESKRLALDKLRDTEAPLAEQPAQILKQLPEVYIYSDQVGDGRER